MFLLSALGSLPRSSTSLDIPPVLHLWFCIYLSITCFAFLPFPVSHFAHTNGFLCLPLPHLFEIFPPGKSAFKAALMTTHPLPSYYLHQTYRLAPRYSVSPPTIFPAFFFRFLKTGPTGCLETSVRNYHYSVLNQRGSVLKSYSLADRHTNSSPGK